MKDGKDVCGMAKKHDIDVRTATLMLGVGRVADAINPLDCGLRI